MPAPLCLKIGFYQFSGAFTIKLGSWPNREVQRAYAENPEAFQWSLLKKLDYKAPGEDYSDDLELLYMMCLEEYPQAQKMRPGKR